MKRSMRGGYRLALVSITAVLTSLGSVPAFAADGPLATVPTTTVDAAATGVDQLSDTATSVAGAADTAAASTVDTVSNLASGASGTITSAASGAGDSVAASTGNLTDAGSDTRSATAGSSDRTGGSSSHGTSSHSTQGASSLRSGRERTALTLADGAEHPRWAVHATAPCPDAGGPRCSQASGSSEENSLAEKISEVIGLLALTGFALLPWIAVMLALTILGSVALERARGTASRARRVSAA